MGTDRVPGTIITTDGKVIKMCTKPNLTYQFDPIKWERNITEESKKQGYI